MPTYNGKYQKTYNLKKDHAEIKKQIKTWELRIDEAIKGKSDGTWGEGDVISEIEAISQEMMAINI